MSQQKQSLTKKKDTKKVQKDRIIFLLLNFKGQVVEVLTKSGETYEGIFHSANVEKEFSIVLKLVRLKSSQKSSKVFDTFIFQSKDIIDVTAKDITFANEKEQYQKDDSFVIDGVITKNKEIKEKELVPWTPETGDDMPLESDSSSTGGLESMKGNKNWNQFEVNERKYGVKSSYNENYYTTELDKSSMFYKENEKYASKMAKEIENSTSMIGNVQVALDRGKDVNMTEEDLYSSVIRATKEGSYVPPSRRNKSEDKTELTSTPNPKERTRSNSYSVEDDAISFDDDEIRKIKNERNRSMSVLISPKLKTKMTPVLSLDPASSPTITPEIYNEYRKFAQKEQINRKEGSRKPKDDVINDIKKFSKEFKIESPKTEAEKKDKKPSLNVNAKAFVFNPSTPAFQPKSFQMPTTVQPLAQKTTEPTTVNKSIKDEQKKFESLKEFLKDKSTTWSIPKTNIESYKQSFMIDENVQMNPIFPPPMFGMNPPNFIPNQFMGGPPPQFFQGPPPQFFQGPPPDNFFMNQPKQNQYKKK
eukprot:gene1794-936_t